jgi:hypothetical protein
MRLPNKNLADGQSFTHPGSAIWADDMSLFLEKYCGN